MRTYQYNGREFILGAYYEYDDCDNPVVLCAGHDKYPLELLFFDSDGDRRTVTPGEHLPDFEGFDALRVEEGAYYLGSDGLVYGPAGAPEYPGDSIPITQRKGGRNYELTCVPYGIFPGLSQRLIRKLTLDDKEHPLHGYPLEDEERIPQLGDFYLNLHGQVCLGPSEYKRWVLDKPDPPVGYELVDFRGVKEGELYWADFHEVQTAREAYPNHKRWILLHRKKLKVRVNGETFQTTHTEVPKGSNPRVSLESGETLILGGNWTWL